MMEKLVQMKKRFLKFLPKKSVASMAFQNPTMSPSSSVTTRGCRSHKQKVSIIPKEARIKHRIGSFRTHEPSSPKVSCMGQVQCKKRKAKKEKEKAQREKEKCYAVRESLPESWRERVQDPLTKKSGNVPSNEKKGKVMLWIFKGSGGEGQKQSGKGFVLEDKSLETAQVAPSLAPSLGAMKKFTSGRGSLCDFDVKLTER